jgi:hypothetical protein
MESQDSPYRKAMIYMKKFRAKSAEPEVCLDCVGWKHFGGVLAEDVTMGPMCVCDDNWNMVRKYILIMKEKKLLII